MSAADNVVSIRPFVLVRKEDVSGVSGTGMVAEGVEFTDGRCALRWRSSLSSMAMYDSLKALEAIHGHGGRTELRFL